MPHAWVRRAGACGPCATARRSGARSRCAAPPAHPAACSSGFPPWSERRPLHGAIAAVGSMASPSAIRTGAGFLRQHFAQRPNTVTLAQRAITNPNARGHRIEADIGEKLSQPGTSDVARPRAPRTLPCADISQGLKPWREQGCSSGHGNDALALPIGGRGRHALRNGFDETVLQRHDAERLHAARSAHARQAVS